MFLHQSAVSFIRKRRNVNICIRPVGKVLTQVIHHLPFTQFKYKCGCFAFLSSLPVLTVKRLQEVRTSIHRSLTVNIKKGKHFNDVELTI